MTPEKKIWTTFDSYTIKNVRRNDEHENYTEPVKLMGKHLLMVPYSDLNQKFQWFLNR